VSATLLKRRSGVAAKRAVGRARRHFRVRKNVNGTAERPRLVVTRSLRHITAQVVDEHGQTLAMVRRAHLESHELVEEFMLLANRCVGSEGAERRSGMLYRVHEPPGPPKLVDLDTMLRALTLPRLGSLEDPARALQELLRAPLDPARRRVVLQVSLPPHAYAEDVIYFPIPESGLNGVPLRLLFKVKEIEEPIQVVFEVPRTLGILEKDKDDAGEKP